MQQMLKVKPLEFLVADDKTTCIARIGGRRYAIYKNLEGKFMIRVHEDADNVLVGLAKSMDEAIHALQTQHEEYVLSMIKIDNE